MSKTRISIIVAAAGKNRVIGKKGGLPWYIPAELKRFKEITMGHPIIMGRKTYESIGRPLPGRTNLVVTKGKGTTRLPSARLPSTPLGAGRTSRSGGLEEKSEIIIVNSLEDAIDKASKSPGFEETFIIGGGQIYQESIGVVDKLYLTYIDKEIEGDTFFPDYSEFKKVVYESDWQVHEGIRYKFLELER